MKDIHDKTKKLSVPAWLLKLPPLPKMVPANVVHVPVFAAYNHLSHVMDINKYQVVYGFNDTICVSPYSNEPSNIFEAVVHKYVLFKTFSKISTYF
jgi:hypothetical protein